MLRLFNNAVLLQKIRSALRARQMMQFRTVKSSLFSPAINPSSERTAECCIGYFGLNRSLNKTARSIRLNITEALQRSDYRITSVAHFNSPTTINSPRSGEHHVVIKQFGTLELRCELSWLEPQSVEKIESLASFVMDFPIRGEVDPEGTIRINALLQMYSQSRLMKLLETIGINRFKVFCLARADLLYLDNIPSSSVSAIAAGELDIVTPSWHRWGGFNDRFALCSEKGARLYLDRINWVEEFCREKGYFHPEEILQFSVEKTGLKYDFMSTRARRVRSTGVVRKEDFTAG